MEELLKCQICFEQYDSEANGIKHPILFTCGHGVRNKIKNRNLMKIVEAYGPVRNEMNNLREINESVRQLSSSDQAVISNIKKENEKLSERLERVRANHRDELLHWQRTNSELENRLETREKELVLLKSKYELLKDSISTHCGLLLTQINNNDQSSSTSSKRKIRD